jgi:hypothetical protein
MLASWRRMIFSKIRRDSRSSSRARESIWARARRHQSQLSRRVDTHLESMQKYERESRLRQSWRNRKNENIWASMILILTLSSSRTLIRESEQRYSSLRKFRHYRSSTSTSRRLAFERKRTMRFLSFEKKEGRTAKQETTGKREYILLDVASWGLGLSLSLMTTIRLVRSESATAISQRVESRSKTAIPQRVWSWGRRRRFLSTSGLEVEDDDFSARLILGSKTAIPQHVWSCRVEAAIDQLAGLITVKPSTSGP